MNDSERWCHWCQDHTPHTKHKEPRCIPCTKEVRELKEIHRQHKALAGFVLDIESRFRIDDIAKLYGLTTPEGALVDWLEKMREQT